MDIHEGDYILGFWRIETPNGDWIATAVRRDHVGGDWLVESRQRWVKDDKTVFSEDEKQFAELRFPAGTPEAEVERAVSATTEALIREGLGSKSTFVEIRSTDWQKFLEAIKTAGSGLDGRAVDPSTEEGRRLIRHYGLEDKFPGKGGGVRSRLRRKWG